MKFFEYLAVGCPVVSTELPALKAFSNIARLANGHDAFVDAVERTLVGEHAPLADRVQAASEQTYERRTGRMLEIIEGVAYMRDRKHSQRQ